jgi:hypothetical protein
MEWSVAQLAFILPGRTAGHEQFDNLASVRGKRMGGTVIKLVLTLALMPKSKRNSAQE